MLTDLRQFFPIYAYFSDGESAENRTDDWIKRVENRQKKTGTKS